MKIGIPYLLWVWVETNEEDIDDAIDVAYEKAKLTTFVGNGGYDRLVGTRDTNVSIELGGADDDREPEVIR